MSSSKCDDTKRQLNNVYTSLTEFQIYKLLIIIYIDFIINYAWL